GKWLAAGGLLGEVTIWDTTGRRIVKTLQERGQSACVAFSPDGNWLAATAEKGVVTLWQTSSWSDSIQLKQSDVIRSLAFSPDSKRLVLFGVDCKVSVWNLGGSNQCTSFRVSAPRHDHHGVVAVSPNNQWLAVGETDGRIRVLALATLTEQFSFPGPSEGITALAFSPDSKLLASGSGYADSTVRIWSLDVPTEARRLEGHAAW